MPEWRVHSLAEVYDFASGLSKPRSEFGSGFPFLSFKDVFYNRFVPKALENLVQSSDAERKKCSVKRGDVFLTRTSETMDELGMSCVSLSDVPDATFNGFTKRLRPKDESYILPEYAGYFFSSPRFRQSVNAMSTMSTRASLNNDMLSRLEIVVPEPDEQLRIANVLKPLDDKIELNRRMNETLEEMARAVFRDWFVDFGPTRRQMAMKEKGVATDPTAIMGHAFPPDKAATLAPLFPDKLGDDGLPDGWSRSDVGSEFDVIMGQSPPGDTYNEIGEGLPFFQGRRDFGFRFPSRRVFCTEPKRISGCDWTLLSVRAPVGDINRAAEKCAIGRGVGAFLHKAGLHSFTYYTGLALRTELQSYDKDGTVFGSINQKQFKGLQVVVPGKNLSARFDEVTKPMDDKIRLNTEENQTLAEMRDLLLPKLMSGEIRLKDVEASL